MEIKYTSCESCSLIEDCLIIYEKEDKQCSCRYCIVKPVCNHFSCNSFDRFFNEIKENIKLEGY